MNWLLWCLGLVFAGGLFVALAQTFAPRWACRQLGAHQWRGIFIQTGWVPWFTGYERCKVCRRKRKRSQKPDDGGYEVGQ